MNGLASGVETSKDYTIPFSLTQTRWYRRVVYSGGCVSNTSAAIEITVSPVSVGGTAAAASGTVAVGASTTVSVTGYVGSIQWEQQTNGGAWVNVVGGSGATTATYTTPTTINTTTNYRAVVTSGACSVAYSSIATVAPAFPFWFKADGATTYNGITWVDETGNNNNTEIGIGSGTVSLVTNSINFNPSLSFSAVDRKILTVNTSTAKSLVLVSLPATNAYNAGLIGTNDDKGIRLVNGVTTWGGGAGSDGNDWANSGSGRVNGVAGFANTNGWQIVNQTSGIARVSKYYIGGYYTNRPYTGSVAEVLAFAGDVPNADRLETYLALKYGITLGHDYINGAGTTIYSISGYANDIAGVAKDATYPLNQKVSASTSASVSKVTMATTNNFVLANEDASRLALTNGQALVWGHNNGAINSWTTSGLYSVVARKWKSQNTGAVGSVNFQIDLSGYPAEGTGGYKLLVDADGNFSSGATEYALSNSSGTLYTATGVIFPASSYFTIAGCTYPSAAGSITGTASVCVGTSNVSYSVPVIANATSYSWSYSGTGATITGSTNAVTVSFSSNATSGNLTVKGVNSCGFGTISANYAITLNSLPAAPTTIGSDICVGSPSTTLVASGAVNGQVYNWYSASSGGSLLKTSSSYSDNTYTTGILTSTTSYWVAIRNASGCEGVRTQVTATHPALGVQSQSTAGTNSWVGHVYGDSNFNNYYGSITQSETFTQLFGGQDVCFAVTDNGSSRSVYNEHLSVRYRMNSTNRRGLYTALLGRDNGRRLIVDGVTVLNAWTAPWESIDNVLFNLTGNSNLVFEYNNSTGTIESKFTTLTLVLSNTLSTNTSQTVCIGSTGSTVSGDVFGTLPAGLSAGAYQWAYSTSSGGALTNISGATGATFTPNTASAPFNTAGTYYLVRNASVTSANNVGVSNYRATNTSNEVVVVVQNAISNNTISSAQTICYGTTPAALTGSSPVGGTGSYTYQWETSVASATTGFSLAGGVDNQKDYNVPYALTVNRWYRRVVYSGTCAVSTSPAIQITIISLPVAPTTIGAQICVGSPSTTLSASGAVSGQLYKWYSASSGGSLLKTSSSYSDNSFTTGALTSTTSYWVAVQNASGCEGARAQVTATMPAASNGDQNAAATNSWIAHVYDGLTYGTYYGTITETESFNETFGTVDDECLSLSSPTGSRSIFTSGMSLKFRMNSTKRGIYCFTLGSDDQSSLTVDGVTVMSLPSGAYKSAANAIMNLTGSSGLMLEYVENTSQNRISFNAFTLLLANNLNTNTTQSVPMGSIGLAIGGDAFGTLPTGLSNASYQWAYSTTLGGPYTNIEGATSASFTPNTSTAPFTSEGVYYLVRKASVTSSNNTGVANYTPTNTSNEVQVTISLTQNAYFGGNGDGYHNATLLNKEVYIGNIYQGGAGRGDIMAQHVNLWRGNISTAWANAANWTGGYVPYTRDAIEFANVSNFGSVASNDLVLDGVRTIGDLHNTTNKKLIVAPATSLTVKGSINTENDIERILIQASSTQVGGTFIFPQSQTAFANVQFYSKAITPNSATTSGEYVWQYMGVPVKTFTPNTLHGWYMRQYLEEYTDNKWWHPVTNATVLTSFKGYEISRKLSTSATGIATFFGELENRDRDIPLTVTNSSSVFKGQHVVSNPYTAAISIGSGLEFGSGVEATAYLYHTGSSNEWDAVSGFGESRAHYLAVPVMQAGNNGLPSLIASMQGFVVKANVNNSILRFRYSGVSDVNSIQRIKQAESSKVSTLINLFKKDSIADKVWVFSEPSNSTDAFDNGLDSRKLLSNNSDAYIYAHEVGEKLQVNSKPNLDNTCVSFKAEKGVVNYRFSFTHLNIDSEYEKVFLIDLKDMKVVDVTASNSEYAFFADNFVDVEKRFVIKTKLVGDVVSESIFVSKFGDTYIVVNKSSVPTHVAMYDVSGKNISNYQLAPMGMRMVGSEVPPGVYLFNCKGDGISEVKKIVIQ